MATLRKISEVEKIARKLKKKGIPKSALKKAGKFSLRRAGAVGLAATAGYKVGKKLRPLTNKLARKLGERAGKKMASKRKPLKRKKK